MSSRSSSVQRAVDHVKNVLGIQQVELENIFKLEPGALDNPESALDENGRTTLLELVIVAEWAIVALEEEAAPARWIRYTLVCFCRKSALSLLDEPEGREEVLRSLKRIEYGDFGCM